MKIIILDHPRPTCIEHYNDVANSPLAASLNTGYAAAIAEGAGWDVDYLNFYKTHATATEMAEQIGADLLLIHWVYTWDNCDIVKDLVRRCKQTHNPPHIVTFGLFPTLCGEELLQDVPGLDMILLGEFEATLKEFLGNSDMRPVLGCLTREFNQGLRQAISDLSSLPLPKDLGQTAKLTHLNIAGSRGCYGKCSFCFIPSYYGRSAWRGRSADHVLHEIDHRIAKRKVERVYFVDPNFFGPGKDGQLRAIAIAEGLAERGLKFGLEARVNDIRPEIIERLKACGLESVFLGIESASPAVLKRMCKGISVLQSSRAVHILQENDVFVSVGFIMFEADSTLADLRLNYEFLESHNLLSHHDITANVLYHNQIVIKGSTAFKQLAEADRLTLLPSTPYEARLRYADSQVAAVQGAMRRLTLQYFTGIDRFWRASGKNDSEQFDCHQQAALGQLPETRINDILKDSFRQFIAAVEPHDDQTIATILASAIDELAVAFNP